MSVRGLTMIEILCVIVGALIAIICMKIEKVFYLLEQRYEDAQD